MNDSMNDTADEIVQLCRCLRCDCLYPFPTGGCAECDGFTCPPCVKAVTGDDDIKFWCVDCDAKAARQQDCLREARQAQRRRERIAKDAIKARSLIDFDKLTEDAVRLETQRFRRSQAREFNGRLPGVAASAAVSPDGSRKRKA